jgi:general secretion pathway protein D
MRPIRHLLATTALVLVTSALVTPSLSGNAIAQTTPSTPSPSPATPPTDMVTMNMRDADIRTLIQWISDQTGRNMVVHKDVQGKVTVLSSKPVTKAEAYRVFLSVLQVHGFAAIETPEAVKILPASLAAQSGVPLSAALGASTGDMVVQTFKLSNISATEMAQTLRPLVSKDAVINADASTNMLLIADHAANVNELQNLVQRMDRSGGGEVELVKLENANAKEIVASLSGLYPSSAGGAPGGQGGGALPLSIAADERSNSVLLSGDSSKRAQAKRLIKQMDKPLSGEGNTQVIYLQYATAKEVAPILKSIAQSVLKDQKDKAASFSIEPSESANALVVNAPPGLIANLREVVTKLDIQRAQVLVEALIVEVSADVSDDLGITWTTANLNDSNKSGGVAAVNTLGNLSAATITTDTSGNVTNISPAPGITFGYLKDGNIRAAIRALSANTKANVLSTPTVVAIDNEPASLLVGQNVPFITGQATSAASGTANPFTTIERKDIGISLEITPRINQGDAITLDIKQKVESIAPSVEGATDLVTNKREINTKALIKDGAVLVLGGLISDDETTSKQKVPILGDMPLIGKLFSSTGHDRKKQNLMVFIHPVILKDQQQISDVSGARYRFMQNEQKQAQKDEPTTTRRTPQPAEMEDFNTFSKPNRPVAPTTETSNP